MKYSLLWLPLALAACTQAPSPSDTHATPPTAAASVTPPAHATTASTDATTLETHHWRLSVATGSDGKRIDALFARPDRPVQLDFAKGRIDVSQTCNRMGGNYSIKDGRLQVGPMMHTMMACADPALMKLDDAIDERLRGNPQLSLQADGDPAQLHLRTDGGEQLVFVGEPTAQARYGGPGETAFLEVAAQTVPCNHPLMPGKECLQVRDRHYDASGLRTGTPGAWHPLNQDIEGYTHETGVRNVLRVKRYTIKNPPADAPNTAYVLDMVVESDLPKP